MLVTVWLSSRGKKNLSPARRKKTKFENYQTAIRDRGADLRGDRQKKKKKGENNFLWRLNLFFFFL